MNAMFNETMSSTEAMRIFFEYADAHRGEDMEAVKEEYRKVSRQIIQRESAETKFCMTSYHID